MEDSKIVRCTCGDKIICEKAFYATSWWHRTKGLMFKKSIGPSDNIDGMMITYCNSVHTFFMRFPLDLIFLDQDDCVVKVIKNKSQWSMTFFYWKANKVLELPVGKTEGISKGDKIEVEYV